MNRSVAPISLLTSISSWRVDLQANGVPGSGDQAEPQQHRHDERDPAAQAEQGVETPSPVGIQFCRFHLGPAAGFRPQLFQQCRVAFAGSDDVRIRQGIVGQSCGHVAQAVAFRKFLERLLAAHEAIRLDGGLGLEPVLDAADRVLARVELEEQGDLGFGGQITGGRPEVGKQQIEAGRQAERDANDAHRGQGRQGRGRQAAEGGA